jgi:threonine aldolase
MVGMNADAIVVFNQRLVEDLGFRLRRSGHTWSKMRFAAVQLLAYVESQLFLRMARRANGLAGRLADGLQGIPEVTLLAPAEVNEVFVRLPEAVIDGLTKQGFLFFRRAPDVIRLVCRFEGTEQDVDRLLGALRSSLGRSGA